MEQTPRPIRRTTHMCTSYVARCHAVERYTCTRANASRGSCGRFVGSTRHNPLASRDPLKSWGALR